MSVTLSIGAVTYKSRVNGPGNRCVVWTQGCSLRCPDCFNPSLQPFDGAMSFSAEELADRLATADGDGLTISGGEPFDQSEALCGLMERYKELCGKSVIVFTGYEAAELMESVPKRKALLLADAVLSGRFIKGDVWANKRLLLISNRIRPEEIRPDGSMEMSVTNDEVFMSGYPMLSRPSKINILKGNRRNG